MVIFLCIVMVDVTVQKGSQNWCGLILYLLPNPQMSDFSFKVFLFISFQ